MKIINLHGVVGWDINAKEFSEELDKTTGDILLDLNSGGGYITDGVAILNKMRSYDRGKITARVSYAASMMTQIALAADEVQVYDNSIFMIHNALGVAMGDYREMEKRRGILKSMSSMLAQSYIKKTGKTKNEVLKMMDDETYLYGNEILDEGFADTMLDAENDENQTKDEAIAQVAIKLEAVNKALKEENVSMEALSACVGGCNLEKTSYNNAAEAENQDSGGDNDPSINHNTGDEIMNISELKAQHPELFAEAVSVGVNQERERVSAHLTLAEASGETAYALECINAGTDLSALVSAKHTAAGIKNSQMSDRAGEGVPPVNTPEAGTNLEDEALNRATAEALGVEYNV